MTQRNDRGYTKFNAFKGGFFGGRDFAVKLRQIMKEGGSLDDVLQAVERDIPPQYKLYRSQDNKLVRYALRVGMLSHPIHLVRGLIYLYVLRTIQRGLYSFKEQGGQSLEELLNSLPVLKDPEDPENREWQEPVMSVVPVNGVLHAQYVRKGIYVEKPVGFSYTLRGIEHTFSLSDKYERVPIIRGSVVIPLSVIEEDYFFENIRKNGGALEERVVHSLGVRIENSVLQLWIYNKTSPEPFITLVDDPDVNLFTWQPEADFKRALEEAVEPIQSARRHYQVSELGQRINEFVRSHVFPIAGVVTSLALMVNVGVHAARVNFPEQLEPSRLRSKIEEVFLSPREPSSCQIMQLGLYSQHEEDQLRGDLEDTSKVFYDTLSARGYLPPSYDMRHLRALNAGRGYEIVIGKGSDQWRLIYRPAPTPLTGFSLIEHGTNQSVKKRPIKHFVMDQNGMLDYILFLNPKDSSDCMVILPYQLTFRAWREGGPWEDLGFARDQKMVARKLEEIAKLTLKNPNYYLLRNIN